MMTHLPGMYPKDGAFERTQSVRDPNRPIEALFSGLVSPDSRFY